MLCFITGVEYEEEGGNETSVRELTELIGNKELEKEELSKVSEMGRLLDQQLSHITEHVLTSCQRSFIVKMQGLRSQQSRKPLVSSVTPCYIE